MNIAIITGASSGIGEQFLRQLVLERGSFGSVPFEEIWVIARRSDRLLSMKNELDPVRIRVFESDLTAQGTLDDLKDELQKRKPTIGLLVNCAGVGHNGRFETVPREEVHKMIALNCAVLAEFTSVCIPFMIPLGDQCTYATGPRILNIASSAGFLPQPGSAVYAATKSFVISFSRALHSELRIHNIASTTVCPGPVATEFAAVATGVPGAKASGFKSFFVVKPARLVRKSILVSKKGRGVYVYGFSQKCFHLLTKILPNRFLIYMVTKLSKDARPPKAEIPVKADTALPGPGSSSQAASAAAPASTGSIQAAVQTDEPATVPSASASSVKAARSADAPTAAPAASPSVSSSVPDAAPTSSQAAQILAMFPRK